MIASTAELIQDQAVRNSEAGLRRMQIEVYQAAVTLDDKLARLRKVWTAHRRMTTPQTLDLFPC